MRHTIAAQANEDAAPSAARYEWRQRTGWSALAVEASGMAVAARAGLGGGVHHGALLGLHAPARRRHSRVPRHAPALAHVDRRCRRGARRSGRAVRRAARRRAASSPRLGVPRRRLGDRGSHAGTVETLTVGSERAAVVTRRRPLAPTYFTSIARYCDGAASGAPSSLCLRRSTAPVLGRHLDVVRLAR